MGWVGWMELKKQVFCADCRVRLSDSIYPPALSRRARRVLPKGSISKKKYVCHDCSVIQAFQMIGGVKK